MERKRLSQLFVLSLVSILSTAAMADTSATSLPSETAQPSLIEALTSYQQLSKEAKLNPKNDAVYNALSLIRKASASKNPKRSAVLAKLGLDETGSLTDSQLALKLKTIKVSELECSPGYAVIDVIETGGGVKSFMMSEGDTVPSISERAASSSVDVECVHRQFISLTPGGVRTTR